MTWFQPSWLFTELAIATVKVTLLLVICWIIAFNFKKQSAALRHRLWAAGILGALLLPPVAVLIPAHYARGFTQAATHWTDAARSAPMSVSRVQPGTAFVRSRVALTQNSGYAIYLLILTWTAGLLLASLPVRRGDDSIALRDYAINAARPKGLPANRRRTEGSCRDSKCPYSARRRYNGDAFYLGLCSSSGLASATGRGMVRRTLAHGARTRIRTYRQARLDDSTVCGNGLLHLLVSPSRLARRPRTAPRKRTSLRRRRSVFRHSRQ